MQQEGSSIHTQLVILQIEAPKCTLVDGFTMKFRHKDWCLDNWDPPELLAAFHQLTLLQRKLQSTMGQNLLLSNCTTEPLVTFSRYTIWCLKYTYLLAPNLYLQTGLQQHTLKLGDTQAGCTTTNSNSSHCSVNLISEGANGPGPFWHTECTRGCRDGHRFCPLGRGSARRHSARNTALHQPLPHSDLSHPIPIFLLLRQDNSHTTPCATLASSLNYGL